MPNLVDIVEVAEALESKAVYLASDRCVVVRNRHASCAKCADACPTGSVFAANTVLELDGEGCVACGACTTVCPVEALIPLRPLDEDLASSVASAVAATGGKAVFACARIASKRLADPAKYAEVPCLARMEESVLLGLAARGVEDIVLVDGTCATCKFRSNVPGIDATVASANELMAAQGSDVRVRALVKKPRRDSPSSVRLSSSSTSSGNADACLKSCLTVNSTVSTEELFDFEPRLIHLPNPPARPGILSSLRR